MSARSGASRQPLRLAASDAADLEILSAAVQDAVFKVGDIAFDPKGRRLALRVNRFRWESAARGDGERVQSLLLFEDVLSVRSIRLKRGDADAVASLLAIRFEPDPEPPGGAARLILAGGGEVRAQLEVIDASLADLTDPWRAARRPDHGAS